MDRGHCSRSALSCSLPCSHSAGACSTSSVDQTTSPSQHPPSSISSQRTNHASPSQRKMRWTGLLVEDKIESLRAQFGSLIVCPGFAGVFGRKADDWGRVFVPGAADSYSEAKKIWTRWARESENEKYSWWPQMMREKGIQPITCKDVLDGISLSTWQTYRRSYARCRDARRHRHRRTRLRNEALHRAEQEAPVNAAQSLLRIGTGAT